MQYSNNIILQKNAQTLDEKNTLVTNIKNTRLLVTQRSFFVTEGKIRILQFIFEYEIHE